MNKCYNVLALSGGKDSVSTMILDHCYNGHQIDEIVYVEVYYDLSRGGISAEPLMAEFIKKKVKPWAESRGYKFTVIHSADHDYLSFFNHVIRKARMHPENVGKRRGFPLNKICGIKRDCKMVPMDAYLKTLEKEHGKIMQFVGICADEAPRLRALYKNEDKRSLLAEFGLKQADSRALAVSHDLLSPTYDLSVRSGCFFCPWAKIEEFAYMKENHPEIWSEFVALEEEENLCACKWNVLKKSLKELDSLI